MSEHIIEIPDYTSPFDPVARTVSLGERIVRCRDCKHATPDTSGRKRYKGYLWCDELTEGIGFSVAPNDFCAWGKRKESE